MKTTYCARLSALVVGSLTLAIGIITLASASAAFAQNMPTTGVVYNTRE